MTVTVVSRYAVADLKVSLKGIRSAKALFLKHGAQDFRLNQIFTGPHAGQYIVAVVYANLATFAKVRTSVDAELKPLVEKNAKLGDVLQEREVLVSVDL